MFKNVAGQSIELFAFDKTTNSPKTGDAGNISTFVAINSGAVSSSGNTVTEWNSIKAPGWYLLALSQAETNGDALMFTGTSATANILIVGRPITTLPANFTALSISGGAVTAGTVSDKTGYSLSVTPPTAAQIATGVWQDATAGDFTTASSIGKALYVANVVPGAAGGHFIAGTNAATTITTGLTTHFIGTVDTVTNLTNAPTAGDFTATMKTSAQTAADAAITANALVLEIEADTDTLTGFITVAPPTANANADALLGRNIAGGSSSGRIVTDALRFLRNKWSVSGTTLTVTQEDDTTSAWTATVSTDATALPITGSDPA